MNTDLKHVNVKMMIWQYERIKEESARTRVPMNVIIRAMLTERYGEPETM